MITKKEVALIRKSWAIVRRTDDITLGDVFYTRLFYENPGLRQLFPHDMEQLYKKLFDMLNIIVLRIDSLHELKGEISAMARRHVQYGVKAEHYNMVGKALVWTLQKCLDKEWNDEIRSAWINCYAILSGTMIAATAK